MTKRVRREGKEGKGRKRGAKTSQLGQRPKERHSQEWCYIFDEAKNTSHSRTKSLQITYVALLSYGVSYMKEMSFSFALLTFFNYRTAPTADDDRVHEFYFSHLY